MNISLAVCTATLFVAFPLSAQKAKPEPPHENNGHHNPKGNGSDHGGHDEDGGGKGHDDDDKGDKGGSTIVLKNPGAKGAVAAATTSVVAALSTGTLRSNSGALIPASAQARTYAVLVADRDVQTATADLSSALSSAGPEASAILPSLMRSLSSLESKPEKLPGAITQFNRFTAVASSAFISNPAPEFVALHTVLARLTTAANNSK
jgi:hypothetical protein